MERPTGTAQTKPESPPNEERLLLIRMHQGVNSQGFQCSVRTSGSAPVPDAEPQRLPIFPEKTGPASAWRAAWIGTE